MKKYYILCSLLLLALLCPAALKTGNYVIINQVMYDTPLEENPFATHACNGEFIELYNAGKQPVCLGGWYIESYNYSESNPSKESAKLPNVTLPSGGYLIMACSRGENNGFHLKHLYKSLESKNPSICYYQGMMLANSGEILTLYDNWHDTIDQVKYGTDLVAANTTDLNSTNGDSCVSLHRTWVEFDENGKAIIGANDWTTDLVSFGVNNLPHDSYYETYLTGGEELPTGDNYILTITPLDPTTSIKLEDGNPHFSSAVRTHAAIRYMDGLGRTEETIALGVTPSKKDLVCVTDYYGKRNVSKQWLPVVAETEGQRMDVSEIQERAQDAYDQRPYKETKYDNSSDHRILEKIRPGKEFESHGEVLKYEFNQSNEVLLYTVKADGTLHNDTYYSPATLYKAVTLDEDKKSLITYTDKQGRKVMEHRGNLGDGYTYYVYDDLGRLRYILPGMKASYLKNGDWKMDDKKLKAFAYYYQYDNRGNVIYKRLPGCEPQYMVYDQMGQLVLKQDGNQRVKGKWTFCVYDSIGRNIIISEIKFKRKKDTHENLVKDFADKWSAEPWAIGTVSNDTQYGYALSLLKPYGTNNELGLKLLLINYYDNYDFLGKDKQKELSVNFDQKSAYNQKTNSTIGLLTGTCVFDLSEDGYTTTANYYDDKGRVVQTHSRRSRDRYEILTNSKYNFDGSVAETKTIQGIGTDKVTEQYKYAYDHAGRLLETKYQLNDKPEVTLSKFSYDENGRLVQNLLYGSKDVIHYSYDIQNKLTEIQNKHFSEKLYYDSNLPKHAKPCYNGNISAATYTQSGTTETYDYTYDDCNRLHSSVWELSDGDRQVSEAFMYYDDGNISSITRYKKNTHGDGYTQIDDMDFEYGINDDAGYQLLDIYDDGEDADVSGAIEYTKRNTGLRGRNKYDQNGNLTYESNRGITRIVYNLLNLPDTIDFVNGNKIINHYNAAGQKYKTIVYTVAAPKSASNSALAYCEFDTETNDYHVTEYFGNIEQCTTPNGKTRRIFNSIGYYSSADNAHYHYIKDHIGNVRVVVNSETGAEIQSTTYYASGVPMTQRSEWHDNQPYLYNGKEFVEAHGYDTYDYGFRGYYATIGSFTTMDPLCEQTPWQSPYAYANNNFVNNIDYMGLMGIKPLSRTYCDNAGGKPRSGLENRTDLIGRGCGSGRSGSSSLGGFIEYDLGDPFGMDYCQLTILNDFGRVVVHIDCPNKGVYWLHDGELTLLGTELDDESYFWGTRPYFLSINGGIICYYYISKNEDKKWSVVGYRSDDSDRRMDCILRLPMELGTVPSSARS